MTLSLRCIPPLHQQLTGSARLIISIPNGALEVEETGDALKPLAVQSEAVSSSLRSSFNLCLSGGGAELPLYSSDFEMRAVGPETCTQIHARYYKKYTQLPASSAKENGTGKHDLV